MEYAKPQIACTTNALIAVQSTRPVKSISRPPDFHGNANKKTSSARISPWDQHRKWAALTLFVVTAGQMGNACKGE